MNHDCCERCAAALRAGFLARPFGVIQFWGFAVVRPNDQSFELVAADTEGDRLLLTLRPLDVPGSRTGVLEVVSPQGCEVSSQGVRIQTAERLRWDDCEAWTEEGAGDGGSRYGLRTPRGQGGFEQQGRPALTLQV